MLDEFLVAAKKPHPKPKLKGAADNKRPPKDE
jgi:hypothetical protein